MPDVRKTIQLWFFIQMMCTMQSKKIPVMLDLQNTRIYFLKKHLMLRSLDCSGWSCRNHFTGRIHIRIHYMNRCLVLNSIILKKIKKTTYKAFLLLTYYCLLLYNLNTFMERCLSGRKYLSWKQACRKIPGVRIPLAPYLKQKYLGIWRRGRAVIQRFAKPSVPKGPGRFNPCRLRY